MEPNKLLDILHTAERLKDTLRHCDTSKGRRESVAEHSWRLALMAFSSGTNSRTRTWTGSSACA